MLTNMEPPPEGNFCDDSNPPMKPHIVEQYYRHMGCVNNSDHKANSYSMSRRTFKWTMKLFFHLLDLRVINSWILLSEGGAKYTHWDFRILLVRNLIEEAGKGQDCPTRRLVGWSNAAATNVVRLEIRHNQNWPAKLSNQLGCRMCSSRGQRKGTVYRRARCDRACAWCLVLWNITPK